MADVTFNGTTFTGEGTYDQAAGTADTPLTANLVVSGSSDSSTITLSGGVYTTGNLTHSKGILNIAEGSVNSCNNFGIQKGGANGTTAYIYGTVNANSLTLNKTGSCTAYLNISGNLTVSGNVIFNGAASGQGILTQTGGTVNFTTSTDQGIVIGHYETSANFPARYNLSNGTFNALNSTVYVGWNGPGELNVSGGEANLKGIQLVGGWNSTTGYAADAKGTINLTGGKLNIGANGVTLKNSRHAINLGDGTIGALASHSWANTLTVTLTSGKTPTFDIDADKTITINSTVTGTGNLKKTGAGTLTLSQSPGYTGATTVSGGTLTLSAGGTLYNLSGSGTVGFGSQAVTFSNSTDSVFSGTLQGSGTLTKTGAGDLTLNYNDRLTSFTGKVVINKGGLTLGLSGNGDGMFCWGTTIEVDGATAVLNGKDNILGYKNKNSKLYLSNGGALNNTNDSGHLTVSYAVYMNNGKLTSNGAGSDSYGNFILDNIIYVQSGKNNIIQAEKLLTRNSQSLSSSACGGVFDVSQNAILTIPARIMGPNVPLIKDGAGDLVLSGVSTYTKATNVNAGKLILSGKGNLTGTSGVSVASGATLEFTNSASDGEGGAVTFDRIISGAGNLVKSGTGTMELTAANSSFTGATTISGGTLKLTGEGTLGTSPVTVGANAALEIAYDTPNTPVNFSSVTMTTGDVFNAGSAFKVPSGTVTFGTTDVALNNLSGGEFENGQITVPSSLTVAGKLTLNNDQLTKFIGSITAPVVEKTGLDTLQLCFDAQNGVDITSMIVSSGRMDLKGYMLGGIEVDKDAVFSPGNSVGDAKFGGGYELKEGATLLIEQDETGIDTLTASSFVIDDNSILELTMGSVQPGASYPIILNTSSEGFQGDLATDNFWNGLLTPESANYWNLSVVNGNTVYASIDANAVPEPSTWALLILGAAGLLYLRKRKN